MKKLMIAADMVFVAGSLMVATNTTTCRDSLGRNVGLASTDSSRRTTCRDAQGRLQGTKK